MGHADVILHAEWSEEEDSDAGIIVNPTSGLLTTESGSNDTFTVALNTQPAADVTINLSSDDTGEGTVNPTSLTFTTGNWSSVRTVTVTGVDDAISDGSQRYTIVTAAAVPSFPESVDTEIRTWVVGAIEERQADSRCGDGPEQPIGRSRVAAVVSPYSSAALTAPARSHPR